MTDEDADLEYLTPRAQATKRDNGETLRAIALVLKNTAQEIFEYTNVGHEPTPRALIEKDAALCQKQVDDLIALLPMLADPFEPPWETYNPTSKRSEQARATRDSEQSSDSE